MIHGSRTIRGRNGMRSGISLVEMMIAVILFGVISIVGFKYSSNFYNTDLVAKKARVAALVEQASQLSNAYDVYSVQFGTTPTDVLDLNASNAKILTTTPTAITEIGTGWVLSIATDYTGSGNNDIAFSFPVTNVTPSTSNEEYCSVFNNMISPALSLDVDDTTDFGTSAAQFTALGNVFCFGTGATIEIVLLKEVN
ncbi:type II secretion system protein [Sulfurimonas sp. SAG-AH-194-I05]|nr:type II secretion system protein [Sulfurimonas sp. SAG-AH-194-I05]MDF1874950.1 type II secretion system protein [Sulfurimonas sp. SAG-AH-194-I05]